MDAGHYPASDLFRLTRDDDSLQIDFMATIHGITSYDSLKSRARFAEAAGEQILSQFCLIIIASKRAADRPRGARSPHRNA
jgi:hypothetical protein